MDNNRRKGILSYLPYLMVLGALLVVFNSMNPASSPEVDFNRLTEIVEKEKTENIVVKNDGLTLQISGQYQKGANKQPFSATIINNDIIVNDLVELLKDQGAEFKMVNGQKKSIWVDILVSLLPLGLTVAMLSFMMSRMSGGGGMRQQLDVVKSRAKLEKDNRVRFTDVAGADEEKAEIQELIEFLRNPKKFQDMGARIPKGILLVGPPGTGKTLLAKAAAGEADVPFYSISGSDFVELFVGAGAARVRDMFKTAQETAPCIIFIDEIDAVGRKRGAGMGGGNDEREQTLNQLLVEMDGISQNKGILIMAATNRADVLDPALLRPGRFDRQVQVALPDRKARKAILEVHARNKKIDKKIDLDALAQRTPGFSGADLENVMNEAAILAVREDRDSIQTDLLDEAIDRVMMGPAKPSRKYSEKDKKLVSYHEAGHAVIGLNLDKARKVTKITIIPRGDAGGYNLMVPEEEKFFHTKNDLLSDITGLMGGRAAEEIIMGEVSSGASNDIEQATKIARQMVVELGMSDLGPIQYEKMSGDVFLGRDYGMAKDHSEVMAAEIDKHVRKIIDDCYDDAKKILNDNINQLHSIAQTLFEEETITSEQIQNIAEGRAFDDFGNEPSDIVESETV